MPIESPGSAQVTLENERLIICRLAGNITGPVVQESMRRTKQIAQSLKSQGLQPLLLIDINAIVSQNSEARSRAKLLGTFGFERIAVCGGSRPIVIIGQYIAKAGGMGRITKFFPAENAARQWLLNPVIEARDSTRAKRLISAFLVALIGVGVLLGWHMDVPVLRTVLPSLQSMSPAAAVTFILLAICLTVVGRKWRRYRLRRWAVGAGAVTSIILGIFNIASLTIHSVASADVLLFAQSIQLDGSSDALSAQIAFICLGLMLLLLLGGQPKQWQSLAFFAFSTIVFLIAFSAVAGYSFGLPGLYNFGNGALPLNSAFCFLLLNFGFATVSRPTGSYLSVMKTLSGYWQAFAVGGLLLIATGVIWQQTKYDVRQELYSSTKDSFVKVQESISSRLLTYSEALSGYRALFAASSQVSAEEFGRYFSFTELATRYPGFNSITYAAMVPDNQKQKFTNDVRGFATASYPAYKEFALFPANNNATHYPIIFIQPQSATPRYGFDLSSETVRKTALEKARDTGQPVTSGIINLNASRGPSAPPNPGFFIALPVYQNVPNLASLETVDQRRNHIHGFMLAYFQNTKLFDDLFKTISSSQTRYTLIDTIDGTTLYTSKNTKVSEKAAIVHSAMVPVGDRNFELVMRIGPQFAGTKDDLSLPNLVLASGLLLTLLATALVLGQLRRRDQAMRLASAMTEDLSAERNIAVANQRKDEAILSSIGDAVFAVNKDGRITLFNHVCERISGCSREEAVGKPYTQILRFVYAKNLKPNDSFIRKALAGKVASMEEATLLIRPDGKQVAVADSAAPIHDSTGKLLGAIVVFRDVSKEIELDRAKTEFVSLASHQLRTPLSAINWYSELLLSEDNGRLTKTQKEYAREIAEGNRRMVDLVNALLDVSRLDLGKLSNNPAPNDMRALVASLETELITPLSTKALTFKKEIARDVPTVLAEPKLLRMIVQNLLSNAVKYTPDKGTVTLTIRLAPADEIIAAKLDAKKQYFFMSVQDTGYGIPKSQQEKIFSKLFRADNVRALNVEGTGLGLYIVKQITEKLGGRVWFESMESIGTTFYVLLPVKTKAAKSNDKQPGV